MTAHIVLAFVLSVHPSVANQALPFSTTLVQTQANFTSQSMQDTTDVGLVVIVGTHGSGSTMLSDALAVHPCIISIGEPFGDQQRFYAPSEAILPDGRTALFRNNSALDPNGSYEKLKTKVRAIFEKRFGIGSTDWLQNPLFQTRPIGMYDFFSSIRDRTCAHIPSIDACRGRCIFAHKLFPDYVSNVFEECEDYLLNEATAVIHLQRQEEAVAESNSRRFNGYRTDKIVRDEQWNEYIKKVGDASSPSKVWQHMDFETITESPRTYYEAVAAFLGALGLNDDVLMRPVRELIDQKYAAYSTAQHFAR